MSGGSRRDPQTAREVGPGRGMGERKKSHRALLLKRPDARSGEYAEPLTLTSVASSFVEGLVVQEGDGLTKGTRGDPISIADHQEE